MAESVITTKYRTTVPQEVREKLGVKPGDVLKWEVVGNNVRVTAANRAFLRRKGMIKVGPGDPVKDVRKARELIESGLPPGNGAFDSGHTDTAARAEEVLGELGFGRNPR